MTAAMIDIPKSVLCQIRREVVDKTDPSCRGVDVCQKKSFSAPQSPTPQGFQYWPISFWGKSLKKGNGNEEKILEKE
jgi:hypothetical protein